MAPILGLAQTSAGALTQPGAASGFTALESVVAAAGMLFVIFLVVATVAEQILEMFRGFLSYFGITLLSGGVTVEQAKKLAREFLPPGSTVSAKVEEVFDVGKKAEKAISVKLLDLQNFRDKIPVIVGKDQFGNPMADEVKLLTEAVATIRSAIESSETSRILMLRVLSCLVCWMICYAAGLNAFAIVADSLAILPGDVAGPATAPTGGGMFSALYEVLAGFLRPLSPAFGYVGTAFAASAGSGYWHDVLDKVRATKAAVSSARTLVTT